MPNGRGRPPPPPLTLAQPPVATLAPRCAQRSAGSGGPLRHGRLCRRPGRPVPAESPSRALGIQGEGKGVRPKASQSAKDFLIELPERDPKGCCAKKPQSARACTCTWRKCRWESSGPPTDPGPRLSKSRVAVLQWRPSSRELRGFFARCAHPEWHLSHEVPRSTKRSGGRIDRSDSTPTRGIGIQEEAGAEAWAPYSVRCTALSARTCCSAW